MYRVVMSILVSTVFVLFSVLTPVYAAPINYGLTAATAPPYTRGQDIQFSITIDTAGATITSSQVGLSYQTQYLQYVSTTPGDAMNPITATESETGKLVFSGSNASGFSGKGVLAYVNFKIIAAAPGQTELCTLYAVATSPTTAPTAVVTKAASTPLPTKLPNSGSVDNTFIMVIAGVGFLAVSSFLLVQSTRPSISHRRKHR